MYQYFGNQLFGLIFFSILAFATAYIIVGARKLEQVLISAAIITAPWCGGIWIQPLVIDCRLSEIFILAAFLYSFSFAPLRLKKINVNQYIIFPLILLIIWASFVSLSAIDVHVAFGGVYTFAFNVIYFVTILKAIRNTSDFNVVLNSIFMGVLYTAIIGILQYKISYFSVGFIDRSFTKFMYWRSRSTFYHANQYGFYHLFILPLIFRSTIMMFGMKNMKRFFIYGTLLLISIFTLYITSNRGSWIGFVAGMGLTIGWDLLHSTTKKNKKTLINVSIILGVFLLLASVRYGARIYERLYEGSGKISNQAEERKELNEDAYKMIAANPIKGVGVWNFEYHSDQVIFTHNLYLYVLSEVGYPGFVLFLLPLIAITIIAIYIRMVKNFYVSNLGSALLATMVSFGIAAIPGPDYWVSNQVACHLWIVTAAILGFERVFYNHELHNHKKKRVENFIKLKNENRN